MPLSFDQIEKFRSSTQVLAKNSGHHRRRHHRILLFDTAHHHAQVLGFDDNRHALGTNGMLDGVGNLLGQFFLNLQTPRIHVDNPRHLGQAEHFTARQIADVTFADERQ